MNKSLTELKSGESGIITVCEGGHMMNRRLETMGIRPGKKITRISAQFMAGPITVSIDGRQCAMGQGIARKVKVEPGTGN